MLNRTWAAAFVAPALLATVFAGAACGGDDDDSPATTVATSPAGSAVAGSSPADAAVEIPAGAPEIDQDNLKFKPDKLTVKVGDKVYMKNSETAIHTVNVNNKNVSGTMKKGAVFVWTAPEKGTYKITCDFHPQMTAQIVVE